MSSAIGFNLDKSRILSSGNGLIQVLRARNLLHDKIRKLLNLGEKKHKVHRSHRSASETYRGKKYVAENTPN